MNTTVEAWFLGGPADGTIRPVQLGEDGQPPPMIAWRSGELYVGSSDQAAPATLATYELAGRDRSVPDHPMWLYEHTGTLS